MNQIARQLKEKNIAEYLIYMWQEEDLIRANHGELEEIEANVIARYPEDQRPALREWYGNLITMMNEEGVREKGHLQINKNIIINLTELHNALTSSPKFPFYSAAYFKALPFIVELRNKNGKKEVVSCGCICDRAHHHFDLCDGASHACWTDFSDRGDSPDK